MIAVAIGFVALVLAGIGLIPIDVKMPVVVWVLACLIGLPALYVTGKVVVESANDGRLWARRTRRNRQNRRRFERRQAERGSE